MIAFASTGGPSGPVTPSASLFASFCALRSPHRRGAAGTAARIRVSVESADRDDFWGTIGVSENIIEASWLALVDAIEYKLYKDQDFERPQEPQLRGRSGS